MAIYEERMARDMALINEMIGSLGKEVEASFHASIECLLTGNREQANRLILNDHIINRHTIEIKNKCQAFVALHMPSAGHLRRVTTATAVADELERIGDHAVTICREAIQISALPKGALFDKIEELIGLTKDCLRQALTALTTKDVEIAKVTIVAADKAREELDDAINLLMQSGKKSEGKTRNLIGWFAISNALERMCLRAQNLCEETLYIETGELAVDESRYYVLFVDVDNGCCGNLAEAIGRKHYKKEVKFLSAGSSPAKETNKKVQEFADQKGLKIKDKPKSITDLNMKSAAFDVVIALQGDARTYFTEQPYHTVFLNWNIDCDGKGEDLNQIYRTLRTQIDDLMSALVGEGAKA